MHLAEVTCSHTVKSIRKQRKSLSQMHLDTWRCKSALSGDCQRTERAQLFLVSLSSKKYCHNFQVVTNICEQYLICQFLALELASSLDRLCKWKCVYPHAPLFPGRSVRLHYLQPSGKTGSHWWLLGTTFSGQFMVLTTKKEHRR